MPRWTFGQGQQSLLLFLSTWDSCFPLLRIFCSIWNRHLYQWCSVWDGPCIGTYFLSHKLHFGCFKKSLKRGSNICSLNLFYPLQLKLLIGPHCEAVKPLLTHGHSCHKAFPPLKLIYYLLLVTSRLGHIKGIMLPVLLGFWISLLDHYSYEQLLPATIQ